MEYSLQVLLQFLFSSSKSLLSSYRVPVQFRKVHLEFLFSSEIPNGVHLESMWSSGGVQVESMQMCG